MLRKIFINDREQLRAANRQFLPGQTPEPFPIRGIDFDPETNTLFTGDEAGYLQKWNLAPLLEKLKTN